MVTKWKLRTGSYDLKVTIRDLRKGKYGNGSYEVKVTIWKLRNGSYDLKVTKWGTIVVSHMNFSRMVFLPLGAGWGVGTRGPAGVWHSLLRVKIKILIFWSNNFPVKTTEIQIWDPIWDEVQSPGDKIKKMIRIKCAESTSLYSHLSWVGSSEDPSVL